MASDTTTSLKPLLTPWGETLDKDCPLNDYPRPQLKRQNWQCLNGTWNYAIKDDSSSPEIWDGEILVPFSPESVLSGVSKTITPTQTLWYSRNFTFKHPSKTQRLLLHFGAVDQSCTVYCNGTKLGFHSGGYWPFHYDITDYLSPKGEETIITLSVQDESNQGDEAYGKQKEKRGGIWYTGQSGIWQTVWCELVPEKYIESIKITPLYKQSAVRVDLQSSTITSFNATISVFEQDTEIAKASITDSSVEIPLPNFKSWTPDSPFLYTLKITQGKEEIESYFGMREFSVGKNKNGQPCFTLNGKPLFQSGLLDQGYWSDGMYTAPSDKALIWDITQVKKLGFNMLRKHIKIEPMRWYYHCDRLGMLVWQDFVSGGSPYNPLVIQYLPWLGIHLNDTTPSRFGRQSLLGQDIFMRDMSRTIDLLYNSTSICTWVPFNEGWGQFNSVKITAQLYSQDPTRLIDHASGYHDQGVGDYHSYHIYYKRFRPKADAFHRILALTEFGGYSLSVEGHTATDTLFGYKIYENATQLNVAIKHLYYQDVLAQIPKGLNVSIYTQVSDVEDEINGLFTYDRKKIKISTKSMQQINQRLYKTFES